jgi:hypothetical protein
MNKKGNPLNLYRKSFILATATENSNFNEHCVHCNFWLNPSRRVLWKNHLFDRSSQKFTFDFHTKGQHKKCWQLSAHTDNKVQIKLSWDCAFNTRTADNLSNSTCTRPHNVFNCFYLLLMLILNTVDIYMFYFMLLVTTLCYVCASYQLKLPKHLLNATDPGGGERG